MAIELELPGDKSLAHRYLIFDYLSGSRSTLSNLPKGKDVVNTKSCLESIRKQEPILDCGNSGTTARHLCGILTGIKGNWTLTGDQSLQSRPMDRIIDPLIGAGAQIDTVTKKLPLKISGTPLNPFNYELPVASAQVKSTLLMAGLIHKIPVKLTGKIQSRDHTEIFIKDQGLNIEISNKEILLDDTLKNLKPFEVTIPGDPSSAAFLIIKRILTPGDDLVLKNLLLNPTRTYYLKILKEMGCSIRFENQRNQLGEKVGDVLIQYRDLSELKNLSEISMASLFIDEIPALSLLITQLSGDCVIKQVQELEVKESNRITELHRMYKDFGIQKNLEYQNGDMKIFGDQSLQPKGFESVDHRLQMTAALLDPENIKDSIKVSYPEFEDHIALLNS